MSKPRNKNVLYRPPSPPRWRGRDSLDLAHQLNQRFFKVVSEFAAKPAADEWSLIAQDRELWSKLDARTIERASSFPFMILNVNFTSEQWWREIIRGGNASQGYSGWPASVSEQLMNEALIFAWHTAKWDRGVARLSLGMSPVVAELIAALTPQQLATISAKHSGVLRLRWQDDPQFWTRLLAAARGGDEEVLSDIHLHANLLLCGELGSL
jgi:hypothetical protein